MDEEEKDECPICLFNEANYFTECNHSYCINCLCRIKKCAICRHQLHKSKLNDQISSTSLLTATFELRNYQPSGTGDSHYLPGTYDSEGTFIVENQLIRVTEYSDIPISFDIHPEDRQPSGIDETFLRMYNIDQPNRVTEVPNSQISESVRPNYILSLPSLPSWYPLPSLPSWYPIALQYHEVQIHFDFNDIDDID